MENKEKGSSTRIHLLSKLEAPNIKCSKGKFMFANIKFGHSLLDSHLIEWAPEHEKMGKGVTLTGDELKKLRDILNEMEL